MEKVLNKKVVYKGRVLRVVEKEIDFGNGRMGTWETMFTDPAEGVSILGVDTQENVYLIRQFKGGTETRMIHLPSGSVPTGVTPQAQAAAEFQEETGYHAGKLTQLITTRSNPGYTDAKGYLFLAEDLTHKPIARDETEDTELVIMTFSEALEKALKGEIEDQRTIIALLLFEKLKKSTATNALAHE